MRANQKLKTNVITEWLVVGKDGLFEDSFPTRHRARLEKNVYNRLYKENAPHRIAKVIVTK